MSKYLYLLDAGHGGINPEGIYTTAPAKMHKHKDFVFYEGVFNRQIVKRIAQKLKELGIDYKELAHEFVDTSLSKRTFLANNEQKKRKCILFSIHGNASSNLKANGWEVFTSPRQDTSDLIANELYENAEKTLKGIMTMRPHSRIKGQHDKEANFWMLVQSTMPAVLSENGFFTNEKDARFMISEQGQNLIAQIHVDTIIWCENNIDYIY